MRLILLILILSLIVNLHGATNSRYLRFGYGGGRTIDFHITVKAYRPRGLKVSFPHRNGVEMFSFHGKVNSTFSDIDGDILAQDITRNTNGEWVFEDRHVQLNVNDVLHFWIYLQFRGAGQRFNDLSYTVKKLIPGPFPASLQIQEEPAAIQPVADVPTRSPPSKKQSRTTTTQQPLSNAAPAESIQKCECINGMLKDVWTQMNATAGRMSMIEESYSPLEDKLNSLTETVDELIKNMNIGTKLLLTGNLPVRSNPVEDVRHLLIEKLKLQDLSTSILQAEYQSNGIAFDVTSSIDKLRILKRSKDILSKLSYQIVDPEKEPILDIRSEE